MKIEVMLFGYMTIIAGLLIFAVRLLILNYRKEIIVNIGDVKIDYEKKYYEYRSILLKMDDEIPSEFNGSDWELIAAVLNDSPYAQKQARYTFQRIVPIENKQENKNTKIKYYYQ